MKAAIGKKNPVEQDIKLYIKIKIPILGANCN
jgi:hypothetical protein